MEGDRHSESHEHQLDLIERFDRRNRDEPDFFDPLEYPVELGNPAMVDNRESSEERPPVEKSNYGREYHMGCGRQDGSEDSQLRQIYPACPLSVRSRQVNDGFETGEPHRDKRHGKNRVGSILQVSFFSLRLDQRKQFSDFLHAGRSDQK